MNILMMTNTFTPHVGGVARSVSSFVEEFRKMGHRVVVVAPEFEGTPENETDVIRIPAIQNFNGSDFSVPMPVPGLVTQVVGEIEPDIVHAHHPFLLGNMALRVAHARDIPIVFTHHTMYEQYTHYVPGGSPRMAEFAIQLSTGFANLCDLVIAPSRSVADILESRGVSVPIAEIPTGIDILKFGNGDGKAARAEFKIPAEAKVIGHMGRLAPEKNLEFLAGAVGPVMKDHDDVWFLVIGGGPSEEAIRKTCEAAGVADRLAMPGKRQGQELVNALHAMDVFAFASQSETQGMVLAEAMAAGVPVVALDAPGAREVVRDGINGRLLMQQDEAAFADALKEIIGLDADGKKKLHDAALLTAREFSIGTTAHRMLQVYHSAIEQRRLRGEGEMGLLEAIFGQIKAEWDLAQTVAVAAATSLMGTPSEPAVAAGAELAEGSRAVE